MSNRSRRKRKRVLQGQDHIALGTQHENLLARIDQIERRFAIEPNQTDLEELRVYRQRLDEVEQSMVMEGAVLKMRQNWERRMQSLEISPASEAAAEQKAKERAAANTVDKLAEQIMREHGWIK